MFEEGKLNGEGSHIDAEGNHYEGKFKEQKKHGKGLMVYKDGRV